jgi:cytochrome c2
MTCTSGDRSCETPRRRVALVVLALMAAIFFFLSWASFVDERGQAVPDDFSYKGYSADEGKRVFQSYNCMGCHTIVGNGAYFGPDLTNIYEDTGPAWLEAFIPSAASWPTGGAVRTHLITPEQQQEAGATTLEEYVAKYAGVADRVDRRGGMRSHMPNLSFREGEVAKLIAFFKYTSAMNTEGWPPKVETGNLEKRLQFINKASAATVPVASTAAAPAAVAPVAADPAQEGAAMVANYGCTACHAADQTRMIGPGWGGLYNRQVTLADGTTVTVDQAYLATSIREPDAHVAEGFPAGVMPAYASILSDAEVDAMVAYLVSLNNGEKH